MISLINYLDAIIWVRGLMHVLDEKRVTAKMPKMCDFLSLSLSLSLYKHIYIYRSIHLPAFSWLNRHSTVCYLKLINGHKHHSDLLWVMGGRAREFVDLPESRLNKEWQVYDQTRHIVCFCSMHWLALFEFQSTLMTCKIFASDLYASFLFNSNLSIFHRSVGGIVGPRYQDVGSVYGATIQLFTTQR